MLPERSSEAEDAFLDEWRASEDTEGLIAAITAAVEGRRPQLAARLVGLLDAHTDVPDDEAIARARRAAALLMLPRQRPGAFEELQAAWIIARRVKMRWIKRRMRGGSRRPSRSPYPRRR